ncbi:MAG TPA: zf-HC2 domain-containing protein [Streptosporangiaceae bacterium]|jgi:anti-sigma factor RsiW|nr:zf-HC2 domain-containing protein [Streptosporangiaceae bacterium]
MTGSADCRDIRHALGVYVLGAIDPAERSVVDAHLSTCPECCEELAGLAGLPALLRRIPVGEAQQLADDDVDELPGAGLPGPEVPSAEMLPSLLGRATQARQARRWRGLAAAAAVVLVAGIGGAAGWSAVHHAQESGEDSGSSSAMPANFTSVSATDPVTHVAATVRYAAKDWGTMLDTKVKNVPAGDRCQLLVTDSSGHTTVVGSWTTSYDESSVWYPGSSGVTLDSVRSFEVMSQGKVLVRVPAH